MDKRIKLPTARYRGFSYKRFSDEIETECKYNPGVKIGSIGCQNCKHFESMNADRYKGRPHVMCSLIKPCFEDLPKFTSTGNYHVNADLDDLLVAIQRYIDEYNLDMEPDFQRGHVWNEQQQIAYLEYLLMGGMNGRDFYFNHTAWNNFKCDGEMVCVDGLQRYTAIKRYLNNEIPAFGLYFKDMENITRCLLSIHINDLATKAEVVKWYYELNFGGTPHSDAEKQRIEKMLEELNSS